MLCISGGSIAYMLTSICPLAGSGILRISILVSEEPGLVYTTALFTFPCTTIVLRYCERCLVVEVESLISREWKNLLLRVKKIELKTRSGR